MKREELSELLTFMAVAEERSFTRAAARIGISQSGISHTLRRLEANLGVRLLNRTTRSVTPTEQGLQLLETLKPTVAHLEELLDSFSSLRTTPKGNIRITVSDFVATYFVLPRLSAFLSSYPDINIEVNATSAMVDIIDGGFDAGIRLGDQVEKDMIAVRIGHDTKMVVAASPAYIGNHGIPLSPSELVNHKCINIRMASSGAIYSWEFEKDGKPFRVKVDGQLTCDNAAMATGAAIEGIGVICLLREQLEEFLARGTLVELLSEWTPVFPGFHLYYPSRKQNSAAFQAFVNELRCRS